MRYELKTKSRYGGLIDTIFRYSDALAMIFRVLPLCFIEPVKSVLNENSLVTTSATTAINGIIALLLVCISFSLVNFNCQLFVKNVSTQTITVNLVEHMSLLIMLLFQSSAGYFNLAAHLVLLLSALISIAGFECSRMLQQHKLQQRKKSSLNTNIAIIQPICYSVGMMMFVYKSLLITDSFSNSLAWCLISISMFLALNSNHFEFRKTAPELKKISTL